ncbi:MAG: sulfite exporter TauE/SafE family protein [Anaerolineae bacterium]|nr:sulfite exporter TauE/SafE family protein [Anaerolineae bacterium]MCO5197362.1 sulfite exporter TauE/SafE family protein [Anaerolineae bacterium]MCO5205006.1 sulfite exporter TauE/SafE family protein [Anaerolineae bacterium]
MERLIPVVAGFVIGVLIGLTGMGGGALTTPFLVIVMRMHPVTAVGTDLVFAAITKIVGGTQHIREKNVRFSNVMWLAFGSLPAALLGAQAMLRFGHSAEMEAILSRILGVVLIVVAAIFLARVFGIIAERGTEHVQLPTPFNLVAVGAVGGILVGVTSIGGGTVIMALLLIFFSMHLNEMVGMDVVHGAILAGVASISYVVAGETDWGIVFSLLLGSIPGVWLGARLLNRIDRRIAKTLVAVLVLAAGIHLLVG